MFKLPSGEYLERGENGRSHWKAAMQVKIALNMNLEYVMSQSKIIIPQYDFGGVSKILRDWVWRTDVMV